MFGFLVLLVATTLLSAVLMLTALALAVRRLTARQRSRVGLEQPLDPFAAAEIDQAAARWASEHGHPEAAPLVAAKLQMLQRLGERRSQP
jgi:hypothetical protein